MYLEITVYNFSSYSSLISILYIRRHKHPSPQKISSVIVFVLNTVPVFDKLLHLFVLDFYFTNSIFRDIYQNRTIYGTARKIEMGNKLFCCIPFE
jgi:hypothetical protein